MAATIHPVSCIIFDVDGGLAANTDTELPIEIDQADHCAIPKGHPARLQRLLKLET